MMMQMNFEDSIKALGGQGILIPSDLQSLNAATLRIYEMMRDGRWYRREEIEQAAGQREGMRRMRELRKYFTIERDRVKSAREFVYRLRSQSND